MKQPRHPQRTDSRLMLQDIKPLWLFTYRRLVVLGALSVLIFVWCTGRIAVQAFGKPVEARVSYGWVYEVRGDVSKKGYFFFRQKMTTRGLLMACGGTTGEGTLSPAVLSREISNGSRVVFSDGIAVSPMDAAKRLVLNVPISLNTARVQDLCAVPGIGPATARAIVSYRRKNGRFKSVHELEYVKGIGGKRLKGISGYLDL